MYLKTLKSMVAVIAVIGMAAESWGDPITDANWFALGTGVSGAIRAVAASGNDVYVGGNITTAGGAPVNHVAKWNGTTWSALGSGIAGESVVVYAIAVIGTDVYVGGSFTSAGGQPVNSIARWDGASWSPLGSGVNGYVEALAVMGGDLYVGGEFSMAGGVAVNNIARWDGTAWSTLGGGGTDAGIVRAAAVSGTDLYIAGAFSNVGGVPAAFIAKWNGTTWSGLGSGLTGDAYSLAARGTDVYVGGTFGYAGDALANGIAHWNGTTWSALGSGIQVGDFNIEALAVIGTDLYAAGYFVSISGVSALNIAKWDGATWSALGSGVPGEIWALAPDDFDRLFVGGYFNVAGATAAASIAMVDPEPILLTTGGCEAQPVGCGFLAAKGSLVVKDNADPAKRKLAWKWSKGNDSLLQSDFGNPVDGGTAYKVCVYDQTTGASELVMGAAIDSAGTCADKPCWKAISDKGWAYKNKDANAHGITSVQVKSGAAGKSQIKVLARGANVPAPRSDAKYFDQDTSVIVQIYTSNPASCWSSTFDISSTKKNGSEQFKAAAVTP